METLSGKHHSSSTNLDRLQELGGFDDHKKAKPQASIMVPLFGLL